MAATKLKVEHILKAIAVMSLLVGCSSNKPDNVATAPQLDFECSIAQALGCDASNAGKTVFIGLDENTAIDCGYQLSFYNGVALTQAFNFSGHATAVDQAGILVGVVTHWVNSNQMPVFQIPKQNFKVCAFIDFNNNGQLDSLEPIQESFISVGNAFLPLSNWSNY